MSLESLKTSFIVLDFRKFLMVFLIVGNMLLLLRLNVETNGKIRVSDTFVSVCKTLLGYFWFLKSAFNSLNLAVLILVFLTNLHICWAKPNGIFLSKA